MLVGTRSNWNAPTLLGGGVELGITSLGKCLSVFVVNIPIPYDIEIPFLSAHPWGRSDHVHQNAHATMFRAAFLVTVPNWEPRHYPPIHRMDKSYAVDTCHGDHTTTKENTPPYNSIDKSCRYNSEQRSVYSMTSFLWSSVTGDTSLWWERSK